MIDERESTLLKALQVVPYGHGSGESKNVCQKCYLVDTSKNVDSFITKSKRDDATRVRIRNVKVKVCI